MGHTLALIHSLTPIMSIMMLAIVSLLSVFSSLHGAPVEGTDPAASPVTIDLFYEALCPSCKYFIKYQLLPAWEKLKDTGIMKVNLHGYGNAHTYSQGGRYVFRCQHGVTECQLNQYSTCAYAKLPSDDLKMKFLRCVETNPYTTWVPWCLRSIGADPEPVLSCYESDEGNRLQKEVGDVQGRLNPRLRFVPWILADGDHSVQSEVNRDAFRYVCNHYQGEKPAV